MKKKLFITLTAAVIMLFSAVFANAYILGDTDNDFLITASDARFALRLSVGLEECDADSDQYKAADADSNGTVTASDARAILRVSVGLEKFPDNTEKNQNIRITKMPYTTNGLVINSVKADGDYYVLNITNKTSKKDMAVSQSTYIPYKMYNSAGVVIESGSVNVSQMNYGENCNVKIRQKSGTAKLIFGAANVRFTEATISIPTHTVNGITLSKAPFTAKGLKISSLTVDTDRRLLTADITNNTGRAISGSIKFNTYDASGNSLGTVSISVFSINAGEKIINSTYFSSGTKKITVYDVSVYDSDEFTPLTKSQTTINNLSVPKAFTSSKLDFSVVGVTYSSTGVPTISVKIKNNTGKALDPDYSCFYHKSFDSKGYVLEISRDKIPHLNAGESSVIDITLFKEAKTVSFGNLTVREGTAMSPGKTSVVDGLTTNALSKAFNGLEISDITVTRKSTYTDITFRVTNKTGKPIDSSEIVYKVLTPDNTVIKSASLYTSYALNKNEFTYKTLSISNTEFNQLYFFGGTIDEGTNIPDSSSYKTIDGIRITSAPFASEGLKITSVSSDGSKLYFNIKNETGASVSASSYFYCKVYGADGRVLKESYIYCKQMNAGESCEASIYIPTDAAKITIASAKVYK